MFKNNQRYKKKRNDNTIVVSVLEKEQPKPPVQNELKKEQTNETINKTIEKNITIEPKNQYEKNKSSQHHYQKTRKTIISYGSRQADL